MSKKHGDQHHQEKVKNLEKEKLKILNPWDIKSFVRYPVFGKVVTKIPYEEPVQHEKRIEKKNIDVLVFYESTQVFIVIDGNRSLLFYVRVPILHVRIPVMRSKMPQTPDITIGPKEIKKHKCSSIEFLAFENIVVAELMNELAKDYHRH
jgi:hypothetical protein